MGPFGRQGCSQCTVCAGSHPCHKEFCYAAMFLAELSKEWKGFSPPTSGFLNHFSSHTGSILNSI